MHFKNLYICDSDISESDIIVGIVVNSNMHEIIILKQNLVPVHSANSVQSLALGPLFLKSNFMDSSRY